MSDLVNELHVLEDKGNIFDTNIEYSIPLYQRAYAWEYKDIINLIEDIKDISNDENYYIGSLIVSRKDNKFEVVDGQQRLTSLYILLNCLGYEVKESLKFDCREKSNYTLLNIKKLINNDYSNIDIERIENSIENGIKIIMQEIKRRNFNKDEFCKKLAKVVIYRIEVPKNTDLNRYFEIMNTRGEQLEQHDILKATLMSYLKCDKDREIFSRIWEACSDMTGYVQMHFMSKRNEIREEFFGSTWDCMPLGDWISYKENLELNLSNNEGYTIDEIINVNFSVTIDNIYLDNDLKIRFHSIIDFPYFLIHTLKVYISIKDILHENKNLKLIEELLDDKKLIDSFMKVISHGINREGRINDNKEDFSKDFILCLLRTRYLFDKYILKREYSNDSIDGEWSIKSLHVSGQQSKKKPYYRNTEFVCKGEHNKEKKSNERNKINIMLQSALRVSYTSPKAMHWITQILIWLSKDNYAKVFREDLSIFTNIIEEIAKNSVRKQFFEKCKDGVYKMGVSTPHIVFNYLDFLLWKSDSKKYDNFTFEFRNSIEHWYP